jgi:heme oxygenase
MMASLRETAIDSTAVSAPADLATRLRQATRALHREAESAGVMGALLRSEADVAAYASLLGNLHAVYETLEAALDQHAGDAAFTAFDFSALRRAPALAADLRALDHPAAELQAATVDYVARLRMLAAERPLVLIAHAYVRYLGDLNGGRVLRKVLGDALGLGANALSFYDFGGIADIAAHEQRFRAALAALALDDSAAADLADEARWSFAQHVLLFEQIQELSSRRMRA